VNAEPFLDPDTFVPNPVPAKYAVKGSADATPGVKVRTKNRATSLFTPTLLRREEATRVVTPTSHTQHETLQLLIMSKC